MTKTVSNIREKFREAQRCAVPTCNLEYNHPGECSELPVDYEARTGKFKVKGTELIPPPMRGDRGPTKKNPTLVYLLKVQKPGGPVMTWNGKSFSNDPGTKVKAFSRADTTKRFAKSLLKSYSILKDYKVFVEPKMHTTPPGGQKHRALRGGSRAAKSNPSPRENAELDQAAKKLEDFTGHRVKNLESAYSRSAQHTGLIIGELDLVGYRAKRDGKTERYGHHFKKNSRPLLAVTSDGKQLHIVGGRYEFTEAGIEDR